MEERRREAELDAVVTAEVEKQWAKRREAWQREREARKQLMADVLKARRKQIEEKRKCVEQVYTVQMVCVTALACFSL